MGALQGAAARATVAFYSKATLDPLVVDYSARLAQELSFCNDCDDLSYRRAGYSHLQGTRKGQADHDNGAGQHADRDQSAFTVALHNEGLSVR
jgi:hypothetical protein